MKTYAVMLAAGLGNRLMPMTDFMPKCLVKVAGHPILDYQIEGYLSAGLEENDIYVVTGYFGNEIRKYLDFRYPKINTIHSINYKNTNNMYSLYIVLKYLFSSNLIFDSFLLNNADCLYEEKIIDLIINSSHNNLIASKKGTYIDESMKISVKNNKVINIAKTIPANDAYGVSLDLYKFSFKTVLTLFSIIKQFIEVDKDLKQWTEFAFPELFTREEVYPFDVGQAKWAEVDTFSDLQQARELFHDYNFLNQGERKVKMTMVS